MAGQRNWNMESVYNMVAREFWRLWRMFTGRKIPLDLWHGDSPAAFAGTDSL
jgi:hypothetical protein